jgi:Carboxypeptidase regulatory-like domain
MRSTLTSINSHVHPYKAPVLAWAYRNAALYISVVALLFAGRCALGEATGSIQGKVTDASGASIFGAVITVEDTNGDSHLTVTDGDGGFQIAGLTPGKYNVKISASGLSDWTASDVPASNTPESQPLLAVMQVVPNVTSVTVGLSPEEKAQEQVKQELQQQVLGVIPNYFVAYESNAAPLSLNQKFHLSFKTLIAPATFAAVGITAGIQQIRNSYWQFGQGTKGYAERFGADYGTTATNLLITSVLADSVLHQDPRYFYSGLGTKKQRAWYAIKSAFLSKGNNGKWQPAYAGLAGTIAASEISNLYDPGSRTQYTLLGRGLMFHFAGLIGLNLAEEFLLKKVTSHVPEESAAQPTVLREGIPVTLVAVDGFNGQGVTAGQTVTFVLAQDLMQSGKVLARTGDVASGLVAQVISGNATGGAGSVALKDMTLRAGNVTVPLRSSQTRGESTPMQYKELPGSGKVEVTLFVAANVAFPEQQ